MSSDLVRVLRTFKSKQASAAADRIEALEAEVERWRSAAANASANEAAAEARAERLREAILWALGQIGEWPERKPGEGAFYWRKELRRRAGLEDDKQ